MHPPQISLRGTAWGGEDLWAGHRRKTGDEKVYGPNHSSFAT